ncbi:RidA family protein [Gulosibacter hominis]|uniref:RidA family protein n=1 Tax=Gulosibacter hominis TaxID=2770504 RepID=UPI001917C377|nr:RidA family protein [Gulosibacter hominis]
MSKIETRLAELGMELPQVAAPVAAYVPAIAKNGRAITSGQLPFVAGQLPATGKLGAEISLEQAQEFAATSVLNALAAIKAEIGDLDRITRVVKVVVFVASDPQFIQQPLVANGASELLGKIFGDRGQHVRSAVGVAVLPLDAPVELELEVDYH